MKETSTKCAPEIRVAALLPTKQTEVRVQDCDVLESVFVPEKGVSDKVVWGIRVRFSDGRCVYIRDLSTNRADAELLKHRLLGASLSADFLSDIVEDFLAEIDSLPARPNGQKPVCICKDA